MTTSLPHFFVRSKKHTVQRFTSISPLRLVFEFSIIIKETNKICSVVFHHLSAGTVSAARSVTFENPDLCAIKGSSVTFRCVYNYTAGETVRTTGWYKGRLENGVWKRVELSVDLLSYRHRYEYLGDQQHNCSLKVHDLQVNDTGYYYFHFGTDTIGMRSKTSVHLTVSGKVILH